MNDEQLARIEARLDRIERALERVTRDGQNLVATAADTFDDWARHHRDLDTRIEHVTRLVERATRPETTKSLEAALDQIANVSNVVATAADTIDDWARRHPDLDKRIAGLLDILDHATRPATLKSLKFAIEQLEDIPNLVAVAGDALDDIARQAAARGLPVGTLVEDLVGTITAFIRVAPKIRATLESGMLDERAIDTLGRMARAAAQLADHEPTPVGFLGALRAMSDPEVQRSVGFAVELARGFGATPNKALPSGNGATR